MIQKETTLYFKQGSSDKVYKAWIESELGRYKVGIAFGRRGSTLQVGWKTTTPVLLPEAEKIFDKAVREKKAKGYTEGEAGTPYLASDKEERVTGLNVQLLNQVEGEAATRLIMDPAFGAQEKFDGKRLLLQMDKTESFRAVNRKGLTCGVSQLVVEAFSEIVIAEGIQGAIIDGECIGDTFYAFDMLEVAGEDIRPNSYSLRYKTLTEYFSKSEVIRVAPLATSAGSKRALRAKLRKQNKEGIVYKRLDAPYRAGRPNSGGDQFKEKFVATLTARVRRVNQKRSVALELLDREKGEWIEVGNVTIMPNFQVPEVSAIVEVRYLYAYQGGSLFQPIYLGERDDVGVEECTTLQLKFKSAA